MDDAVYIVTGAAGHLGGHVVRELHSRGRRVRALMLPGESCPECAGEHRELYTEYEGDVCKPETLEPLFEGGAPGGFVVVHCAGIVSIAEKFSQKVYDVNVCGTQNVIQACGRHGARLVYVSSVHAIPRLPRGQVMREVDAFSPDAVPGQYDKTKATATQLVLDAAREGLDAVVVHPSGIIGPNGLPTGNMANMLVTYLRGGLPAAIRGGYDFVDVRDVARGIVLAADRGRSGECYILSNRFVDLRELFAILSQVSGRRKLTFYLPMWVARAVAPLAERIDKLAHRTPFFTRYSLKTISENSLFSHEKASRELGYETRPLMETLADTARWIQENRQPTGRK